MTMWIVVAVIVVLFLLKMFLMSNISVSEAAEKLKDGAVLVDVRTPAEFESGHPPRAINICLDSIGRIEKEIKDKEKPILVYCLSGARAMSASSAIKKMGYADVRNIGPYSKAVKAAAAVDA